MMTLSPQDRDLLKRIVIERYNEAVERVPAPPTPFGVFADVRRRTQESILRSKIQPLPELLSQIPHELDKYTLGEIRTTLLELYQDGELPLP